MKKCPFCAEEIQDAAIKCRYCGEFLEETALEEEPELEAPASVETLTPQEAEVIASGGSIGTYEPWRYESTGKPGPRRPTSTLVVVAVGLAVAVLVVITLWANRSSAARSVPTRDVVVARTVEPWHKGGNLHTATLEH